MIGWLLREMCEVDRLAELVDSLPFCVKCDYILHHCRCSEDDEHMDVKDKSIGIYSNQLDWLGSRY